jgi:hypothetical protein
MNSRPLGINILKKIMFAYPNLNVNWILTGLGDIEINEVDNTVSRESVYGNVDPGYEAFLKYFDMEKATNKIIALIEKKLKENGNEKK